MLAHGKVAPKFSTWEVGSRILPCARSSRTLRDGYPLGEDFINEGRGFSPTHLKFFLLVFSQIKRSQREDQA